VRFFQLLRALVTAHLNRLAADFDFGTIHIQLAVASRTTRCNHDIAPNARSPGAGAVGHVGRDGRCQNL